jgi:hypothetical protein
MRYVVMIGLTLCVGESVAVADPLRLSPDEIDQITAGGSASTLVPGEGSVEILVSVTRDGEVLVNHHLAYAVPTISADLEQSLDGAGTPTAVDLSVALPRVDVPQLPTVDISTGMVGVPHVEPAMPVELAPPAPGQIQTSTTQTAADGITVQRTSVVSHSAGLSNTTARNVNVTR